MEFDGDLFDGSTHELIADEDKSEWKKWKVTTARWGRARVFTNYGNGGKF